MPLGLKTAQLDVFPSETATVTTGDYGFETEHRHAGGTSRRLDSSTSAFDQNMSDQDVESEGRPPYLHVRLTLQEILGSGC